MTSVLLVRHGRTTANAAGILAGWSPGINLDDVGKEQASALAQRLSPLPITHLVSSPLPRALATARQIASDRALPIIRDRQVGELHYGDWTGQELKTLAKHNLWATVQAHPSAMTFPGGESMVDAQRRAMTACRGWAARAADECGDQGLVVIVSHGDIIKAVLADALGMHLDMFQRIIVDPASLSVVQYTPLRPFVERINDCGDNTAGLIPPKPRKGRKRPHASKRSANSDAAIGGSAGSPAKHR